MQGSYLFCMTRPTVLIVDDDPNLLRLTSYLVGEAGYATLTAHNGSEALPLVSGLAAVVTDYQMPLMDGKSLSQAIRQQHPDLPIILYTAHPDIEPLQRELDSQHIKVLPKTPSGTPLVDALQELAPIH
jgi:CheY-like chemotaxis protein